MKNGEIIDRLETLVQSTFIPENITNLTGIKTEDLRNAPTRQKVLREFKEFLGDTIFVAHDAKFDYSFLNASFNRPDWVQQEIKQSVQQSWHKELLKVQDMVQHI